MAGNHHVRLLLTMERWNECRSVLAVLLLHLWCISLVRPRGLHHVRTRAWRSRVSIETGTVLRHVWHVGLGLRRHGRIALGLLWHETARRWSLAHHRRTSSHLRHVRPAETGTGAEAGTHLVHFEFC